MRIWGPAGMILECRITVCNYTVEPRIQKWQPRTLFGFDYSVARRFEL